MKIKNIISFLAAMGGFLAGCVLMYYIFPTGRNPEERSVLSLRDEIEYKEVPPRAHGRIGGAEKVADAVARAPVLRGVERRRVLGDIKRNKVASVEVPFFAVNEFHATNGTLSQQFIDFFELSPAEAGQLSDLIQATKAEMWSAAKSQAQVSQTETGTVVIKIPPVAAGADFYDKVMSGFQTTLGDDRYRGMMLFNNRQFEKLFNEFGAEERTVSIEKSDDERYKITDFVVGRPGEVSSTYSYRGTLDEIKKRNPELAEFVPAQKE